jgi:hypothetical protein
MAAATMSAQPVRAFRPARAITKSENAQAEEAVRAGKVWSADGDNCWRAILCREGVVWITQDQDVQDYVITAGEMFLISQPGKVVAQALVDSRIEITPCLAAASFRGRFQDTIFS